MVGANEALLHSCSCYIQEAAPEDLEQAEGVAYGLSVQAAASALVG